MRKIELEAKCADQTASLSELLELYKIYTDSGLKFPVAWEELSLRTALKEDPKRVDLFNRLREVLYQQGKQDEAVALEADYHGKEDGEPDAAILDFREIYTNWLAQARYPYPLGKRWEYYAQRLSEEMLKIKRYDEFLHFSQSGIGFEHRRSVSHDQHLLPVYQKELERDFPAAADFIRHCRDIEGSLPHTTSELNGRAVSAVLFYLARILLASSAGLPKNLRILEIGAGYGALCRLWHTKEDQLPHQYAIVDLPECLASSYVFLREQFGKEAIFVVKEQALSESDLARMKSARIVLCPVSSCDTLSALRFDLCINTGSLQEMPDEWVSYYMDWITRMRIARFYSLNYFANDISNLHEGGNLWASRPPRVWKAISLVADPLLLRLQTSDAPRRFLESIYEKDGNPNPGRNAVIAAALLDKLLCVQTVAELIDCYRRGLPAELAANVFLHLSQSEFGNIPELLFLGRDLLTGEPGITSRAAVERCVSALSQAYSRKEDVQI